MQGGIKQDRLATELSVKTRIYYRESLCVCEHIWQCGGAQQSLVCTVAAISPHHQISTRANHSFPPLLFT